MKPVLYLSVADRLSVGTRWVLIVDLVVLVVVVVGQLGIKLSKPHVEGVWGGMDGATTLISWTLSHLVSCLSPKVRIKS